VEKGEGEFKMTLENNEKLTISFKIGENELANVFRRTILDEVPTFAIEEVEVISNESPLYDEIIAQRLGLIPLKTDLNTYNLKNECKCGGIGCALCEVKMSLISNQEGYVYSKSIKSDDPKIVPVSEDIQITKLFPNKKIELNIRAVLGKGKEHSKWSPAHTYLKEEKNNVNLIIESHGQLDNKEIFNRSIDELIKKLNKLEEAL
jgi:DNA-directed RNA polymerase subunit D